jgi:hypothetical protein
MMKFSNGDLVKFSPWGMEYPGLGVVISDGTAYDDDGLPGYEIEVMGPDGTVWTLYSEQLRKVQDDG